VQVVVAQFEDVLGWLALAAEVEPQFGPLIDDAGFQRALAESIRQGMAFCIREDDGKAGAPLVGGLLLSAQPPVYSIGWLAVTARQRRRGAGRALVEHAAHLARPPAELVVQTFVAGEESEPARLFYQALSFRPAEMATGPRGEACQVYRRALPA